MKKLLILTIAVVCMGCSDDCVDVDPMWECMEDLNDPCGFLKVWDNCICECDWIF